MVVPVPVPPMGPACDHHPPHYMYPSTNFGEMLIPAGYSRLSGHQTQAGAQDLCPWSYGSEASVHGGPGGGIGGEGERRVQMLSFGVG